MMGNHGTCVTADISGPDSCLLCQRERLSLSFLLAGNWLLSSEFQPLSEMQPSCNGYR